MTPLPKALRHKRAIRVAPCGVLRTVPLLLLTLSHAGCALAPFQPLSNSASDAQRTERREQAIRQFEIHRDAAQFQAAMDRWTAGDPHTCEAQLRSIVGRNPEYVDARRALADLALERGDVAAAEGELRELLKLAPDDSQTHHSLGLLLESTDRQAEAETHLARAITLAPDNTLYRLSLPETK